MPASKKIPFTGPDLQSGTKRHAGLLSDVADSPSRAVFIAGESVFTPLLFEFNFRFELDEHNTPSELHCSGRQNSPFQSGFSVREAVKPEDGKKFHFSKKSD